MMRVTFETDDADLVARLRAALPEESRLQVRFASANDDMALRPGTTGGESPVAFREPPQLTARQRDILRLMMRNMTNKEIGRSLSLSHFTVRNHISQLLRILNVPSRKEAIVALARSCAGRRHAPDRPDHPGCGLLTASTDALT